MMLFTVPIRRESVWGRSWMGDIDVQASKAGTDGHRRGTMLGRNREISFHGYRCFRRGVMGHGNTGMSRSVPEGWSHR